MQAAVWGATGFVGGMLCAAAEERGWSVARLPRDPGEPALAGSATAYHCAGKAGDAGAAGHADAAERFAGLCAGAGVRRLVYLSTVAVYGPRDSGVVSRDAQPQPADAYASSRLEAERRIAHALAGRATGLVVVRVPAVIGAGMPGTVLGRFARAVRRGLFLHPGPADASFACIGVRRLAQILLRVGELEQAPPVLQFCDHLQWTHIASCAREPRGAGVFRIRLPALRGKLRVLASTARYQDDCAALNLDAALPETHEDLAAALHGPTPQ